MLLACLFAVVPMTFVLPYFNRYFFRMTGRIYREHPTWRLQPGLECSANKIPVGLGRLLQPRLHALEQRNNLLAPAAIGTQVIGSGGNRARSQEYFPGLFETVLVDQ